ncbi:MAG: transglycosylase SLT domain-containing protein [Candidatus Bilamarchaeaceae archaeon]
MLGAVLVSESTLEPIIREMSNKYNVPIPLIKAVIKVESNWDINASRYEANIKDASWGLMQVLLGTARDILKKPNLTISELQQPRTNIEAGTAYLAYQLKRYNGSIPDAISAYNAGSSKFNPVTRTYGNQSYVNKVYGYYIVYRGSELVTTVSGVPLLVSIIIVGYLGFASNKTT